MAPYIASELLELVLKKRLAECSWPTYDAMLLSNQPVTVAIQVNGKTRCTITVVKGLAQKELEKLTKEHAGKWLTDKKIIKTIVVLDRLVNFVVK